MQEPVLKISHSNVDNNTWRKRHVFGLQPQMAKRICESCQVQWNKDVVVATSKVKNCQEFLPEKSAWVKSSSHDKVRAHEQLQSTHAFQPHRNMGIWSKQTLSAVLVVFCLNYPPTEHSCKDPTYESSAYFQTLPCTDHVMLSKRRPKSTLQKATSYARVTGAADPPCIGKKQVLLHKVSDLPLTPCALVNFPCTGGQQYFWRKCLLSPLLILYPQKIA